MDCPDMMATCGLDCAACSIRTVPFDETAAREALPWSRKMGLLGDADGVPEALAKWLICEGCHRGRTRHGSADCWIVACCVDGRGLRHCAQCTDFPCDRLVEWSARDRSYAEALTRLRALRGAAET